MVFRYWGDAHADVQQFAPLVDRRAGGIADDVLVEAIEQRGWRALRIDGSVEALQARLRDRQPVIVLLEDRKNTYHYLVVTGATADRIVVHDPSWGPSRSIEQDEFVRLWKATNFWSLVVLPGPSSSPAMTSAAPAAAENRTSDSGNSAASVTVEDRCARLLDAALDDIQRLGASSADAALSGVRTQCPAAAGPLRELAGVRFSERRWNDAVTLAQEALERDPHDDYAWDVLGSSLFMQDNNGGALRAWNRIGKPRVNLVNIEGIQHARYQAVAEALAIRPNALLTAETFERAQRRLSEWPDRTATRLAFRPDAAGFATVDVIVAEHSTRPHGPAEWSAVAARSAIDREVTFAAPGFTGQGELWSASWRWWNHRPRVAVALATPRAGRLPGVWRVDASWETQAYSFDAVAPLVRESRAHGGLTVSDWITGRVRYSVGGGLDVFDGARKTAFVSGTLERRFLADRVSLSTDATHRSPINGGRGLATVGAAASVRSSTQLRRWVFRTTAGAQQSSDDAPFAVWSGAGEGHARAPLLRAHTLLDGGVIDARGSAFGRTLAYANVETQRWFERPRLARVGVAGFTDFARANRGLAGSSTDVQIDLGGGLRIKIPGTEGVMRVDAAHGMRDGANALTVGWQF